MGISKPNWLKKLEKWDQERDSKTVKKKEMKKKLKKKNNKELIEVGWCGGIIFIIICILLISLYAITISDPHSPIKEPEEKALMTIKDFEAKINKELPKGSSVSIADASQTINLLNNNVKLNTFDLIVFYEFLFEGSWLRTDYSEVQEDCTNKYNFLFKRIDRVLSENSLFSEFTPKLIYLYVKIEDKDDYGNTFVKNIAESYMTINTYKKINWKSFEYENLNKITPFSYKEKSFQKDWQDFKSNLESMQEGFDGTGMIEGAPSTLCSDAKEQCEQYGGNECEFYDMLKSTGACF